MTRNHRNAKALTTASLIAAIVFQSVFVLAQDVVTSEDFTGGSSAFVFKSSRKGTQKKTAFRTNTTVKRTTTARAETTRRITRQNVTVAKVAPKRTKAKEVDPRTVKLDSVEFKRKTKEEASVIFAGVGEYYLTASEVDRSIEFFREAAQLDAKNSNATLGLSEALTRKGDLVLTAGQTAIAKLLYEDALRNNKNNAFAYAGLAEIASSKDDADGAILNYEKALALDADLTELNAPLGVFYFQKGEIAKSEFYLQKAIALDANNAETQFFIGLVRYRQNRNEEAMAAFGRSIQLDPSNPEAHYYLGEVYDRLNRDKDAIASYRQAVTLNPRYFDAWFDLGASYYNRATDQGPNSLYYEESIKAYKEALKINPTNGEAHANLADVFRQLRRLDEAIGEYRLATTFIKNDPELYSKFGFVAGLRATNPSYASFWKLSIENLEKAVAINSEYIDYTNLGWAYYNAAQSDLKGRRETAYKENLQKARTALEKAVSMNAKLSAPFLNLGMVLTDLGDFKAAIEALKSATELQKNWIPAINELGLAYRKDGDFDNAVKQFRRAVEIDDNFAQGHYNLAESEYRRGKIAEARKEYEKLKKMKRLDLVQTLDIVTNNGLRQ
jgi:tetratricopeptide (TPR) repeat protein